MARLSCWVLSGTLVGKSPMVETAAPIELGSMAIRARSFKAAAPLAIDGNGFGACGPTGSLAHLFNGSAGDLDHGPWQL